MGKKLKECRLSYFMIDKNKIHIKKFKTLARFTIFFNLLLIFVGNPRGEIEEISQE